ncbi:WD40 repeat domain-containing protein [Paractinoplanes rishiriensis]|uniref:Uncharacterized protein n=1 Tax=Paractinoplanes rishiriensis TaxID=1050105 RepID=A0A919MZ14_9ACTN|nr:WD40 repeat domain-containing protein [Actinoplanes rishiriensis]GIE97730.1 hypothetical protein Ari01nite_51950 [Actinoplanes rishiriensis]
MPPAEPTAADRYALCSRLMFGPGTWFELCRAAAGSPAATAGLLARLAPDGDAALALATRSAWPGQSRLRPPSTPDTGPALSAARAAGDLLSLLSGIPPDADRRLRAAAGHWRRANVLPTLPLTGAGIEAPRAGAVARRLAVLTDDAAARDRSAYGILCLVLLGLTDAWPGRRREAELPVLFDRRSSGAHGMLRLTLLDGGPPGLYPDPRRMLFLAADTRFAEALDVAWRTGPLHDHCVVWTLTTDGLPCDEVAGGSLGAAFGVALADLARRPPPALRLRNLDRRCAITAELHPDRGLRPVGGLRNKLDEAVRQGLRAILATPTDRDTLPEPLLRDARVRFAADLTAAVRLSRTRINPVFAALVAVLMLATGGAVAAVRESRTAHQRQVAAGLLPAAATLRPADPTNALLLQALALRLGAPGARAALTRALLTNRYAGALTERDDTPCGGRQAWSPDGTRVVTRLNDTVRVWDTARRTVDRTIEVPGRVEGCAFAPDGRTIALAVDDRLTLVSADRATATGIPAHHVQFAPDGLLATLMPDRPMRFWSLADPDRPRALGTLAVTRRDVSGTPPRPPLAFSADSRTMVVAANGRVVLADLTRPEQPRITGTIEISASSVALAPDGTLAIGRTDGIVELWSVRDNAVPHRTQALRPPGPVGLGADSVAFTPNGRHLVTATGGGSEIWQLGDGTPRSLRQLVLSNHQVTGADLAPDGTVALVTDGSGPPSFWRLSDHTVPSALATLPLPLTNINGLAFRPEGSHLLVTAVVGPSLWEVRDQHDPRRTGPAGSGPSGSDAHWPAVFDAGARRYAATDDQGGVGVWSVTPDGRVERTASLPRTGPEELQPLALSPDGTLLVVRAAEPDSSAFLWDVRHLPRQLATLPSSHPAPAVAFTPDGRTLLTVTAPRAADPTIIWWNLTDPARPARLAQRGVADGESPIVVAADGRRTFVTDGTGPGTTWDTADPAGPALLSRQEPPDGADASQGLLHGNALILAVPGAMNVWDVTDPAAPYRAAQLTTGDGTVYHRHVAMTATGLVAATHTPDLVRSQYTNESVVRLHDFRPILDVLADPVAAACRFAGHDLPAELWDRHAPGIPRRPVCG